MSGKRLYMFLGAEETLHPLPQSWQKVSSLAAPGLLLGS